MCMDNELHYSRGILNSRNPPFYSKYYGKQACSLSWTKTLHPSRLLITNKTLRNGPGKEVRTLHSWHTQQEMQACKRSMEDNFSQQQLPTLKSTSQGLYNDLQGPTLSAFLYSHVFLSLSPITLLLNHATLTTRLLCCSSHMPGLFFCLKCPSPDIPRTLLKGHLLREAFPDHHI